MQDVWEIIREKGRWEGRQEGRQEGQQQVIRNMLKEKVITSFIANVTGFSKKAIKKLKNGAKVP